MGAIVDAAEEARRRALEIGAQTGAAGVAAYDEAKQRVAQAQQDALARAAHDAAQINAPQGMGFEGLIARPTTQIQQVLDTQQAGFKSAAFAGLAGASTYADKLRATEPYIDRLIAERLAAEAAASGGGGGGSGGGGRGGGGGGGGGDLSDSELRVRLKGAATAQRDEMVAAAADKLGAKTAKRQVTSKARGKVKRQIVQIVGKQKKPMARGVNNRRVLQGAPGRAAHGTGIPRAITRIETRRAKLQARGRAQTPVLDRRLGRLQQTRGLLQERRRLFNVARNQDRGLRKAYGNVVSTQAQSLAPLARQIAVDSGLSADEAYGLISPTEQAQYDAADVKNRKSAGGALRQLGIPPRLLPKDAAKDLKMPAAKARVVRKSKNYQTLATAAQAALDQGYTLQKFASELDSWRQPYSQRVKIKATDKNPSGYKTVKTPGHGNLVDLILFDFAPAFAG